MIANPEQVRAFVAEFRRQHQLIYATLEVRCRDALGLPQGVKLGDIGTALLIRELAQAIEEYQRERGEGGTT